MFHRCPTQQLILGKEVTPVTKKIAIRSSWLRQRSSRIHPLMYSDKGPENRPLSLPTWKGSKSKRMFIQQSGINTFQIVSFYNFKIEARSAEEIQIFLIFLKFWLSKALILGCLDTLKIFLNFWTPWKIFWNYRHSKIFLEFLTP